MIVLLLSLFTTLAEIQLLKDSRWSRADSEILFQNRFRRQQIDEKTAAYIQNEEEPGDLLALYWLETNYGEETFPYRRDEETFLNLKQQWETAEGFWLFSNVCRSIWDDVQYFLLGAESQEEPEFTVSFTDSWMSERTYGCSKPRP